MSVTTTADIKISSAKNHITDAYKDLLTVLDNDTWGHNKYTEEYMDKVQEVLLDLLKLKRKL